MGDEGRSGCGLLLFCRSRILSAGSRSIAGEGGRLSIASADICASSWLFEVPSKFHQRRTFVRQQRQRLRRAGVSLSVANALLVTLSRCWKYVGSIVQFRADKVEMMSAVWRATLNKRSDFSLAGAGVGLCVSVTELGYLSNCRWCTDDWFPRLRLC